MGIFHLTTIAMNIPVMFARWHRYGGDKRGDLGEKWLSQGRNWFFCLLSRFSGLSHVWYHFGPFLHFFVVASSQTFYSCQGQVLSTCPVTQTLGGGLIGQLFVASSQVRLFIVARFSTCPPVLWHTDTGWGFDWATRTSKAARAAEVSCLYKHKL